MSNFSGVRTLQLQMQAIAAGTWAGVPTQPLFSWGRDSNGQLGHNNIIYCSLPVQIGSFTNWTTISQGSSASAAFAILSL
jgi:alpha-tubulin suppressor-like RCC1 family protein